MMEGHVTDQHKRIQGATLKIQNKNFVVYKGVNTIGRNKSAVINLKNVNISQQHAVIMIVDDTQHYISDLHSSNGTYLLGSKLTPFKLYELSNEMELTFGDMVGKYFKVANVNTTVYLETENLEQTQNMTQNFYAGRTQLMIDETNPKELCSTSHHNSSGLETLDFHEVATQVIVYPPSLMDRCIQGIQENRSISIETVSDDFHDAPTQVVMFPLAQASKQQQNVPEVTNQFVIPEKEKDSITNELETPGGICNPVLQVVNENSHDSSTQIDVPHRSIIGETSNNKPEIDDSFIANQKSEDSNVVEGSIIEDTIVEETVENKTASNMSGDSNDSIDFLNTHKGSNSMVSQLDNGCKAVEDENSSELETQGIDEIKKRVVRKLSSSQETLQSQSRKNCNSDSETDIEDGDVIDYSKIYMLAKDVSEIQSKDKTTESDSETDAEDDLLKQPQTDVNMTNNYSETDIDGIPRIDSVTQSDEIIKPKILSKKIFFNSDSDDTDTDIDSNKEKDSTLIEPQGADGTLNDTDCIPATQDAFAEMFNYKKSKLQPSDQHSENVSSEESFKLGLTELMIETEENKTTDLLNEEEKANSPVRNQKESKIIENVDVVASVSKIPSTSKLPIYRKQEDQPENGKEANENLCMMPTQDINTKLDSINQTDCGYLESTQVVLTRDANEPSTSSSSNLICADEKIHEVVSTVRQIDNQDSLNTSGENDEDVYLMPTQQLTKTNTNNLVHASSVTKKVSVDETDEDLYMMPTQNIGKVENTFKVPSKKFIFKKKDINLEESLTDIFNSKGKNDPPIAESIKINEIGEDRSDVDIYMQPTQKLGENSQSIAVQYPIGENYLYSQPTQDLNPSNTSRTKDTELEEDLYIAATQPINQKPDDKNHSYPTVEKEADLSLLPKDPYMNETQKIGEDLLLPMQEKDNNFKYNINALHPVPEKEARDNWYDLPTQPSYISNDTGDNSGSPNADTSSNIKRPVDIDSTVSKRKRVKASDLDNLKEKIQSQKKTNETVNQIEAFVNKPLEHFRDNEANDRVETLSQIEAFIKQPMSNKKVKENKYKDTKEVQSTEQSLDKLPISRPKRTLKNMVDLSKEKEEDRPETLSQIETFIKQPLPSKESNPKILSIIEEVPSSSTSNQITKEKKKISENNAQIVEKPKENVTRPSLEQKSNRNRQEKMQLKDADSKTLSAIEEVSSSSTTKQIIKEKEEMSENNAHMGEKPKENVTRRSLTRKSNKNLQENEQLKEANLNTLSTTEEVPLSSTSNQIVKEKEKVLENTHIIEKHKENVTKPSLVTKSNKNLQENNQESCQISSRKSRYSKKELNEEKRINDEIEPKQMNASNNTTLNSEQYIAKTDVDVSFALLQAKNTKTKKSQKDTNIGEIKIAITKNRRSMTTSAVPESSKKEVLQAKPTTRKPRRVMVNNNNIVTEIEPKITAKSKRKLEKNVSTEEKPCTSVEIPTKKAKLNVKTNSISNIHSDDDMVDFNMEKSKTGKEILSTSKVRASSRVTKSKNTDTTKNSDRKSSTSSEQSIVTPRKSRRTIQIEQILTSPERSKRKLRPKVVFTMLDSPLLETLIKQLGGSVVDSINASTVLVTEHVKRSQKLLSAVGQGKPICSPDWILASKKANEFLDPWDFILIDQEAESKWTFSLKQAITKATQEKLLQDYTFQLMVSTAADVLKGAIDACGGKCVTRHPGKNGVGFFVIVASPENRTKYLKLKKQNPETTVVEPEAIFDGVLRQELRLGRHLLT